MKLGVREAAKVLNVSETVIYRWVDDDEIPFVMIQHHPMFHRVELLEWAIETELPLDADLYEHEHDQPLTAALQRGGGRVLVDGLESAVGALAGGDRELVRAVISARQGEMFTTRAAERIAIPRPRSPIICPDVSPLVALWWTERALVFEGVSVNAVFTCITPTIRHHLALLSRLSRALHDRAIVAAARQPENFEQLISEVRRFEREIEEAA